MPPSGQATDMSGSASGSGAMTSVSGEDRPPVRVKKLRFWEYFFGVLRLLNFLLNKITINGYILVTQYQQLKTEIKF